MPKTRTRGMAAMHAVSARCFVQRGLAWFGASDPDAKVTYFDRRSYLKVRTPRCLPEA